MHWTKTSSRYSGAYTRSFKDRKTWPSWKSPKRCNTESDQFSSLFDCTMNIFPELFDMWYISQNKRRMLSVCFSKHLTKQMVIKNVCVYFQVFLIATVHMEACSAAPLQKEPLINRRPVWTCGKENTYRSCQDSNPNSSLIQPLTQTQWLSYPCSDIYDRRIKLMSNYKKCHLWRKGWSQGLVTLRESGPM